MASPSPYPLPANYSLPAALTGPCVVFLCENVAGGSNPPSCDAALGLCSAGSTSFTLFPPNVVDPQTPTNQSFPCDYDYKNATAGSTASVAVACGLVSLAATVTPQGDKNFLVASLPSASGSMSTILTLDDYALPFNAPQWPNYFLDVRSSVGSLSPYFQSSSNSTATSPTPTPSSKSGSVKGASLTSLIMAGMTLPLIFSAVW